MLCIRALLNSGYNKNNNMFKHISGTYFFLNLNQTDKIKIHISELS